MIDSSQKKETFFSLFESYAAVVVANRSEYLYKDEALGADYINAYKNHTFERTFSLILNPTDPKEF